MRIEFVFDYPCVWSYFTFNRLQRTLSVFRQAGGTAELILRPYQLAPDATVAGEPKREVLRRSFGSDTDDAIAGIESLAAAEGLHFRHARAVWSNTFGAHRLTFLAQQQGLGAKTAERLFRAHHTDELNIADPRVLSQLAAEIGVRWRDLSDARIANELESVRQTGLRTVPAIRFGGSAWMIGAQSEAALNAALTGSASPAA